MNPKLRLVWQILSIFCLTTIDSSSEHGSLIESLLDKVNSYQVLKSRNFTPPFTYAKKFGLYESEIRMNIVGDLFVSKLRNSREFGVYDNNMFVTAWIIATLLESKLYGRIDQLKINETTLEIAIEAINDFHDKNKQKQEALTFWPQEFNSTYDMWYCQPDNIHYLIETFEEEPLNELINVLSKLHLNVFAKFIEKLKKNLDVNIFQIPSDFDDSMINLGIGALLFKLKKKLSTCIRDME